MALLTVIRKSFLSWQIQFHVPGPSSSLSCIEIGLIFEPRGRRCRHFRYYKHGCSWTVWEHRQHLPVHILSVCMGSYCSILTPSLPWCHLKMTSDSMKYETHKPFIFVFTLAWERIFIKTLSTESKCYKTGKCTVYRRICRSFSPEIFQAGAVKGVDCRCSLTVSFDFLYFLCVS